MTWTVKDRRTDAPSDEERAEAEDDRMKKRHALREEIAALQMKLDKAALLRQEIAAIDHRIDAAADVHAATTAPLQSELEELERKAISRIAARQPADAAEDGRRREIIGEITEANRQLEEITASERSLKKPLAAQVYDLTNAAAPIGALQNKLASIGLANPSLLTEQFTAQQRSRYCGARIAAASQSLKIRQYNVEQIQLGRMSGDLHVQQMHVQNWEAELKAATQEQADALATSSAVYQRMVNE